MKSLKVLGAVALVGAAGVTLASCNGGGVGEKDFLRCSTR